MGESDMNIPAAPRLGVVVPPENPTAEPEFGSLFGNTVNVHTTRFPVTGDLGLREMLESYNEVLPAVLASFGRLPLDAAVVSCSASHYLLTPAGDREFCSRLSDRSGFPVHSSTLAILATCADLGLTRLTLVSPYEPWLTALSRQYWEQAGLTVDRVVQIRAGERYDPYAVTTAQLLDALRRHDLPGDGPLLFTGTGMFTLAALEEIAAHSGQVLLSSNLASAWWVLRTVGAAPGEGHPLVRGLADAVGTAAGRGRLSPGRSGSPLRVP